MNLHKKWVIDRPLLLKEREVLFLMLEAAEIDINSGSRTHETMHMFYLIGNILEPFGRATVTGGASIEAFSF